MPTYRTLNHHTNEIRLLRLLPSQSPTDPLLGEIEYRPLDQETSYEAISYTWGNNSKTRWLTLGVQPFAITSNLFECLQALRNKHTDRILWIDAICINQDDILDKNREVLRMLEIYSQAERVLVWLGTSNEDSRLAMRELSRFSRNWFPQPVFECVTTSKLFKNGYTYVIETILQACVMGLIDPPLAPNFYYNYMMFKIAREISTFEHLGLQILEFILDVTFFCIYIFNTVAKMSETISDNEGAVQYLDKTTVSALRHFFSRAWYSRMWIIQEIAVAKNVSILCGQDVLSWEELFHAYYHIVAATVRKSTIKASSGWTDVKTSLCQRLIKFRLDYLSRHEGVETKMDLVDLLRQFGHHDCSDPRDKVYALLGLTSQSRTLGNLKNHWFCPDYSLQTSTVYAQLVKFLLEETCRLDILEACCNMRKIPHLPSWAPDWTCATPFSVPYSTEELRNIILDQTLFKTANASVSADLKILTTSGFEIGRITDIGEVSTWHKIRLQKKKEHKRSFGLRISQFLRGDPDSMLPGIRCCTPLQIGLVFTLIEKSLIRAVLTSTSCRKFLQAICPSIAVDRWLFAIYLSFHEITDTPISLIDYFCIPGFQQVIQLTDLTFQARGEENVTHVEWLCLYKSEGSVHKSFTSAVDVQKDDLICLFLGAKSAFILRPNGDDFTLIGTLCQEVNDNLHRKHCYRLYNKNELTLKDFRLK